MSYISRIRHHYHAYIKAKNKEARFFVLVFFTLTFFIARITVYGVKYHFLPSSVFGSIYIHDLHIHHLVFGIILLLIAGIIRIPQFGDSLVRISSIIYGVGAALTLDESALWLRLNPDAYFGPSGRISIDAVVIFALILAITLSYATFWKKILHSTYNYFVHRKHKTRALISALSKSKSKTLLAVVISMAVVIACAFFYFQKPPLKHKTLLTRHKPPISPLHSLSDYPPNATPSAMALVSPEITPADYGYCLYVPVLMYHHVQPAAQAVARGQTALSVDTGIFDAQMAYLSTHGYTTIATTQLISALKSHTTLPPKSIVLSFDDGYEDIYTDAYPIFKKYSLIANLAIPAGLVGIHAATNYYMSWDQLKDMVQSGRVTINNHTWSHASMKYNALDKDQFEIATAQTQLMQNLGQVTHAFFYPYGESRPDVWELLQKDGFDAAFSTRPGVMECDSSIMNLPRVRIGNLPMSTYGL